MKLGEIGGAPFYISGAQYEAWKHTNLIIDVVPGRGGMFSLDNGRERRFLAALDDLPRSDGGGRKSRFRVISRRLRLAFAVRAASIGAERPTSLASGDCDR